MKYDDCVANSLISEVIDKAKVYWDAAKKIEDAGEGSIFLRSEADFRNWSYNNAISRLLYELASSMEQTRINHIINEDERAHEREMDMMIRMGR